MTLFLLCLHFSVYNNSSAFNDIVFFCLHFSVCVYSSACGIHTCKTTEHSFTCVCLEGYENTSPQHCEDVDECLHAGGNSSLCGGENHTCVNTNGSYTCRCQEGDENIHAKICGPLIEPSAERRTSGFSSIEVVTAKIFLSLIVCMYVAYNLGLLAVTIIDSVFLWVTTEPVHESDEMDEIDEIDEMDEMEEIEQTDDTSSTYYQDEEEVFESPTGTSPGSSYYTSAATSVFTSRFYSQRQSIASSLRSSSN